MEPKSSIVVLSGLSALIVFTFKIHIKRKKNLNTKISVNKKVDRPVSIQLANSSCLQLVWVWGVCSDWRGYKSIPVLCLDSTATRQSVSVWSWGINISICHWREEARKSQASIREVGSSNIYIPAVCLEPRFCTGCIYYVFQVAFCRI